MKYNWRITEPMNKKKAIILSAVILLIVVIAIICIVVFTGGNKEDNETTTTTQQNEVESTDEIKETESSSEEKETESTTEEVESTSEIETESTSEIETTTEEVKTEEPTTKKQSSKNYEIVWSNPYFFTKKFSDGTEKYYFTYMEEADIFGVETTAIGIIPESQYEYLEHSPDYYINGKTGSNTGSVREETTEQQTSGNTSNNQTEQETSSGNTPQLVTIDGVQYMMNSDGSIVKLGGGTMTEEEWNEYLKWREENGFTMTN